MAIKVSGTTVIDDARNANNIINVTASGTVTAGSFSGDGSNLTNAGSTVALDTAANRDLLVTFTGVTSGTMVSANVNSFFKFNPSNDY